MQFTTVITAISTLFWCAEAAAQSNEPALPQDPDTVINGEYRPLGASYALGSSTIIDPPPNEQIDHLRLYITGNDAKRIYRSMPVPDLNADCDGQSHDNYRRKVAGGLECEGSEQKGYVCTVAVTLDTGDTTRAYACD